MSELVMTETENLRFCGNVGWGGSQRSERDTLIRADPSIHQDPPKGIVSFHFIFAWLRDLGKPIQACPH
jgi:hypothetical protein